MPNVLSQSNSPSVWCAYSSLKKFFITELEEGPRPPRPHLAKFLAFADVHYYQRWDLWSNQSNLSMMLPVGVRLT